LNHNVDQRFKYVATWLIHEWSKIGLHMTQRVVPTGPWFDVMRSGNFDVVLEANGPRRGQPPARYAEVSARPWSTERGLPMRVVVHSAAIQYRDGAG